MADDPNEPSPVVETVPTHPEEIKTVFNLRIGKSIALQGSARLTPAGIATAGVTLAIMALAAAALIRARRR
jgi:hypothetical protein